MIQVERITTWQGLTALRPQWDVLAGDMPFRSWGWLATWWKHYGTDIGGELSTQTRGGRQLYVLAVYDIASPAGSSPGRTLIGIAPWYLDRMPIKGRVLRWLGSGEVCTDHLTLICGPEDGRVSAAVASCITETYDDWDRLELEGVDSDDASIDHLASSLEQRQCEVSREPSDSCWVLDLPGTWEDYLTSISKSHRKQLRQLERRVLESDRVRWHRVETVADLDAGWKVLVDLHQRRRRSLNEPGCFASQKFHDFHRELAELLLTLGGLRISWLELDGTPAAAEYHFADSGATYAYQGGVDPDRLDEEPGRLSTILCLRQAIEEGHGRLDFLRGDEPYKAHWRATARPTFNLVAVPNRRAARLRGRVLNLADTMSDWARTSVQYVNGENTP